MSCKFFYFSKSVIFVYLTFQTSRQLSDVWILHRAAGSLILMLFH